MLLVLLNDLTAGFFITRQNPAVAAEPILLQGHLQEDVLQKQVSPELMPGQRLQANIKVIAQPAGNDWCMIPDWLAGTWQSLLSKQAFFDLRPDGVMIQRPETPAEAILLRNSHMPPDEQFESTQSFGTLRDRNGAIWHYLRKPYSCSAQGTKTHWSYSRVLDERIDTLDTAEVVDDETIAIASLMYQVTDIILYTVQVHQLNKYRPVEDGVIQVVSKNKTYDAFGKLFSISVQQDYQAKRIKIFKPIKTLDGQDLQVLFREFLLSHGKANLIP